MPRTADAAVTELGQRILCRVAFPRLHFHHPVDPTHPPFSLWVFYTLILFLKSYFFLSFELVLYGQWPRGCRAAHVPLSESRYRRTQNCGRQPWSCPCVRLFMPLPLVAEQTGIFGGAFLQMETSCLFRGRTLGRGRPAGKR